MQASFTAQSDGTYVRRVRTRQEPTKVELFTGLFRHTVLLAHLREFFPVQYLSKRAAGNKRDEKATRLQRGGAER